MAHVIARVAIRPEAGVYSLRPLAAGDYGLHQLLWKLFPGEAEFLFRETDLGKFLLVSANRPDPVKAGGLFDVEMKPYSPQIRQGEVLGFTLRACATVCREGRRHDIVQDARKRGDERPRLVIANEVGPRWLMHQGRAHGFELLHALVDGYEQRQSVQHRTGHSIQFSTIEFGGTLKVTEPDEMRRTLVNGVGRAKAFGAGLLLVRRIS